MNPNCIYEVKTYWGYFRLDEGAYEDYLKGKLWITWMPREHSQAKITAAPPVHVSDEAVALYNKAENLGVWELLQSAFPYEAFALPFKRRMSGVEIYEMNLSVRASNGLMRAGAKTLGKVAELVALPSGLRSIRNLVTKSEKEILRSFVELCYEKLNFREKLEFWQKAITSSLRNDYGAQHMRE